MIWASVLVAIIYIPSKLGGSDDIFDAATEGLPKKDPPGALVPVGSDAHLAYATLALGSAMALFLYPHALTGVLSSKSANMVRRNAAMLPAYSFVLGLIALLGYMAIAAANLQPVNPQLRGARPLPEVLPELVHGLRVAAIAIGALVPAAVMSIAAANLFTRNIYCEFVRPDATPAQESQVAKIASLFVKVGASPSSSCCRPSTRSTCSSSAACGSCRPSRRW